MSKSIDVGQIYNTFYNLVQELEPFVEIDDLKIAFDRQKNVYLLGNDFQEQLQSNFSLYVEVREELRNLIAKRRSQKMKKVSNEQEISH